MELGLINKGCKKQAGRLGYYKSCKHTAGSLKEIHQTKVVI